MKCLVWMLAITVLLSHPAIAFDGGGRTAALDERNYTHGTGSVYPDLGDLLFYGPEEKPSWASLSEMERLMVGGARGDDRHDPLDPYYMIVANTAFRYYEAFGRLPASLDAATLRSIPGNERASDAYIDFYRNPLTGGWPRLDAASFSPGDFYIRALAIDELRELSRDNEEGRRLWLDHKSTGYNDRGERDPGRDEPMKINLVLYGRMYGDSSPLLAFINTYAEPR